MGPPGSGVTVSCELPDMHTENQTQDLCKSSHVFLTAEPSFQSFAFAFVFCAVGVVCCFCLFVLVGSSYIVQTGVKPQILLPLSPKYWEHRHVPACRLLCCCCLPLRQGLLYLRLLAGSVLWLTFVKMRSGVSQASLKPAI